MFSERIQPPHRPPAIAPPIKATAAGTDQYEAATAFYLLTVNKAKVTITAKDQGIYVNGTVPSLASPAEGTHYTVSGLKAGDSLGGAIPGGRCGK